MGDWVKGTITPLSSLFPAQEAQKAAKRVHDTISDRQKQLDRLRLFIADNTNLINLVQKLPDDLSHDIMVPFGKAAFFPGRLIHTNELLVLLGEGYYADRTAKQTVEILQRRGEALESQVEPLKAMMLDLQVEAKFFDSTAAEAAEGLVEIREDYIEEPQTEKKVGSGISGSPDSTSLGSSKANNVKVIAEEEDSQIMDRLDELEKEELAAAAEDEEDTQMWARLEELEKEELAAAAEGEEDIHMMARLNELAAASAPNTDEHKNVEAHFKHPMPQHSSNRHDLQISAQLKDPVQKSKNEDLSHTTAAQPSGNHSQKDLADMSSFVDLKLQAGVKDDSLHSKSLEYTTKQSHATGRSPLRSEPEEVHEVSVPKLKNSADKTVSQTSKTGFDHRKAFTGSIIEHSHGLSFNLSSQSSSTQASTSNPSRPVSRFKMQKGSR